MEELHVIIFGVGVLVGAGVSGASALLSMKCAMQVINRLDPIDDEESTEFEVLRNRSKTNDQAAE